MSSEKTVFHESGREQVSEAVVVDVRENFKLGSVQWFWQKQGHW